MPRNESVELVQDLLGLDLASDPTQMLPNRFRRLENFHPPRGKGKIIGKRLGSSKYNATAITSASAIDNMVRAWLANGTKRLVVAATITGNDAYYYGDDTLGTFTAITGGTAPPSGSKHFFVNWPLLGELYFLCGDGTTPIQISTNFTTKADMTIGAGATDARFGQFGTVFFSRLITARTPTNPNYIYYFNVAVSNAIGASQFWRISEPVTALAKNTYGSESQSLREQLIAWGAGTMWAVSGDPASATIEQVGAIGCLSPKTAVSTPFGLVFLGVEQAGRRDVYLMNADPHLPRRIGSLITPALADIPANQLINATACFQDGFYKLSVAAAGGTTNTQQYWADFLPMIINRPGEEAVPEWYGPMTNLALKSCVVFDAPGDSGTWRGGDSAAGTVWKLGESASWVDGATTISGVVHTKEFNEGDPLRQKIWNGFTFGYLKSASGSAGVAAVLDSGADVATGTLTWTQSGAQWDVAQWDVDLWGGDAFAEDAINFDDRVIGRTVQLQITHALATDWQLRDFARKAKTIGRML